MRHFPLLSLAAIGISALLISCNKCHTTTEYTHSFVMMYEQLESIAAYVNPYGDIAVWGNNTSGYATSKHNAEIFHAQNTKHGDTSYNRDVTYMEPLRPNNYVIPDMVKIDVVCKTDFDAEHPAGATLNDIAELRAVTPYPYIQSGYKTPFDWDNYAYRELFRDWEAVEHGLFTNGPGLVYPIKKTLDELTASDLILLGGGEAQIHITPWILIALSQKPTAEDAQVSVIMYGDDGSVFESNSVAL